MSEGEKGEEVSSEAFEQKYQLCVVEYSDITYQSGDRRSIDRGQQANCRLFVCLSA